MSILHPLIQESLPILQRTPPVLNTLLRDLPDAWTSATEGPGTWSPYDVVGHLIHGEKADWMVRIEIILEHGPDRPFDPFDREAQFRESQGKTMNQLLDEFMEIRKNNLEKLIGFNLQAEQLELKGMHQVLGFVTIRHLIGTWTAHDMAHLLQISRVMAKRYRDEAGPFAQFLSVIQ